RLGGQVVLTGPDDAVVAERPVARAVRTEPEEPSVVLAGLEADEERAAGGGDDEPRRGASECVVVVEPRAAVAAGAERAVRRAVGPERGERGIGAADPVGIVGPSHARAPDEDGAVAADGDGRGDVVGGDGDVEHSAAVVAERRVGPAARRG